MTGRLLSSVLSLAIVLVEPKGGLAQEAFYKDKVIRIVEAYSAAGGYDTYARLIARHLGKHIKVPLASEFAKTEEARQLLKIGIQDLSTLGHSYTLPPKTRKDRVAILRKAFAETMRDPEFLAEARNAKIIINPSSGGELEEIVSGFAKLSPDVVAKLKDNLLPKK